jgi:hypothetical protein
MLIKQLRTSLGVVVIALAAFLNAAAQNASAQTAPAPPGKGQIVGRVVDSLSGAYLSDADIVIEAGTGEAAFPSPSNSASVSTTDSLGKFKVESLTPGTYRVVVFHARLDTLGIVLITQPFRVGPDSTSVVVLAVPSALTLIARSCGNRAGPYGESAVTGRVADPETLQPVPNAEVSIAWTDIDISKESGLRRTPHLMSDTTNATGAFKICGLPNSMKATLQARRGSAISGEIPISLGDSPFELLRRTVLLSAATSGAKSGNATLSGTVLLEGSRTNGGSKVELSGTDFIATTNERGEFTLRNLPSGTMLLVARHIGFVVQAVAVDLSSRQEQQVTIKLPKFVEMMSPVLVTARRTAALDKVGFNQRRKAGLGFFIGPERLENTNHAYLSDILRQVPGLRVGYGPHGDVINTAEGVTSGRCMQYYMDESPYTELRPGDANRYVTARDIVAVEVYQAGQTPAEYVKPGASCTTIVLWTRLKIRG